MYKLRTLQEDKQGRLHDNPCRGRLGIGSNDLGRGMLNYKFSYP